MAALALTAVNAEVSIVLTVTDDAFRRGLLCAGRLVMAIGALQLRVGAQEREAGLLRVIETP